jgi:hypothetical protein
MQRSMPVLVGGFAYVGEISKRYGSVATQARNPTAAVWGGDVPPPVEPAGMPTIDGDADRPPTTRLHRCPRVARTRSASTRTDGVSKAGAGSSRATGGARSGQIHHAGTVDSSCASSEAVDGRRCP